LLLDYFLQIYNSLPFRLPVGKWLDLNILHLNGVISYFVEIETGIEEDQFSFMLISIFKDHKEHGKPKISRLLFFAGSQYSLYLNRITLLRFFIPTMKNLKIAPLITVKVQKELFRNNFTILS